ncbi:MAG: tRNA 2-thiouridine(34) synthase MnmA [Sphingomonadales bacterium]
MTSIVSSATSFESVNRDPSGTRIVVAMSGGVDSSVVAALLQEQGYDVVGITLQLYESGQAKPGSRTCCAGQDIYDARRVAETLGIDHYVLDYEDRFKQHVMDDFVESYLAGETPIPCVRCNQTVKFHDLLNTARDLGAQGMATGHYVRRVMGKAGAELHRGADPIRDQSYFLFATTRDQLDFLRFPLGGLPKTETRKLAARFGLPVAEKRDSQDICFVPDGSYASVIEKLRPGSAESGEIVDVDGRFIGRHNGIIGFTIGQRRGLGIGGGEAPLYVVRLEPETRRVVVGPRDMLLTKTVRLRDINWLAGEAPPPEGMAVTAKVRSTRPPAAAMIRGLGDGTAEVVLDVAEAGVAPGQACVLYDGDRVLGGGWITAG